MLGVLQQHIYYDAKKVQQTDFRMFKLEEQLGDG